MKVILNTDVTNLGEEGDVCEVKPGYARNFLLPRNLVLLDNRSNRAHIESRRQEIEARKQKKLLEARSTRERIESEPLVFEMPAGENGKLFGSLSSAGISERLEQLGIEVQRRHIDIPEKTIKSVGTYKVGVRLYGEEQAELTVQVQASGGSGKKAAGKQEAATESAPDDRAQAAAEGDAEAAAEGDAQAAAEGDAEAAAEANEPEAMKSTEEHSSQESEESLDDDPSES